MKKEKYELNEEDLSLVTGGVNMTGCPFFVVASGKLNDNRCPNCFYYHNKDGELVCDSPKKKLFKPNTL